MPFQDLREFLTRLDEEGDLARIKRPVATEFEIAAGMYAGDQEETIGADVPEDKEPPSKSPPKTEKVER